MRKIHRTLIFSLMFLMMGSVLSSSAVAMGPSHPCDSFGDSSIDSAWTVVPNEGSITENPGGFLELYYGSYAQRCDWWGEDEICRAPHIYTDIPTGDFIITTRNLNTAAMPAYAQAGIILYLDEENVVFFGSLRDAGLGDGIALEFISNDVGLRNAKAGNYLDQYLRVRRVDYDYYFEYSANGNTWTLLQSGHDYLWGFAPTKVGLFMKDWGSYMPYAAQFDYFDVTPECPRGPELFIIVIIIIAVVAIVLVGLIVAIQHRNQAPKQVPPGGVFQEQVFCPSSAGPASYQGPLATPLPPPSNLASNTRLCPLCGSKGRPGDDFCMNCGALLKSVQ